MDPAVGAPPAAGRVALVAGGLGAFALAAITLTASEGDLVAGTWVRSALVAAWAVAALVLVVRDAPRVGLVALVVAVVGGVCSVTATTIDLDWIHTLAASLLPAVALHLELVIPDGRAGRASRRNAIVAGYVLAGGVGLALGAADRMPTAAVVAGAVVGALVLGLPAAHHTYARATGLARQRLQLLGCSVAIVVEVALVVAALRTLVDWPRGAAEIAAASTALVPLALVAGTSAHIARRVDRVLVHTVSATGLTAVVVAVYLVVVVGLGRVPADTERSLLVLSMVAAAVATIAYAPARDRLAEWANRLVYGEQHPPDEVLRTWGSRLSRAIPMDELLLQLAESLRKVMALSRAEVWTGTSERLDLAVSVPDREAASIAIGPEERPVIARAGVTGTGWLKVWLPAMLENRSEAQLRVAPACHSGELLGLIVVERRSDDDRFDEEDDRVLAELARQVGLALHNVELDSALQASLDDLRRANDDLRASRARIVATGDAERRKIERNLHDGAQQHLVALAVNLRLTKDALGDDPEGAAEMLDELTTDVKDTIQALRELAHGIYPPLLMDAGIGEALRAAAQRSPLDVAVDVADGVGRYPAEVEAAVYFCGLEALQNAAKHAPAARVVIRVWEEGGSLRFDVSDDGPGFDRASATQGHGFVNMSDRLGAIGGAVEWRSAPGEGATVAGSIPLEWPRPPG
ncbi:MAG: sensor histidine kinase [Acidimicrobiales bacterium]